MKKVFLGAVILLLLLFMSAYFLPTWIIDKNGKNIELVKGDLVKGFIIFKGYQRKAKVSKDECQHIFTSLARLWEDAIKAEGKYQKCKECNGFGERISCASNLSDEVNKIIDKQEKLAEEFFQTFKMQIIEEAGSEKNTRSTI